MCRAARAAVRDRLPGRGRGRGQHEQGADARGPAGRPGPVAGVCPGAPVARRRAGGPGVLGVSLLAMASTLITVAPTGAEADKAAVPALPVTLDELVGTAKECQAAGAAVVHVHIRDNQAQPTLDR